MGYRVIIDQGLCTSSNLCSRRVPSVFGVDDEGVTHVIDETPADELRPLVEEALQRCPAQAISIETGGD